MGAGIENRITYDPDEITRLLENQLDKLKVFRFDSRYRSLLGERFINLAARWEKDKKAAIARAKRRAEKEAAEAAERVKNAGR